VSDSRLLSRPGDVTSPKAQAQTHVRFCSCLQADRGALKDAGAPVWANSSALFLLSVEDQIQGEWQLSAGLPPGTRAGRLSAHRGAFISEVDFSQLPSDGVNAVRVPVGYWIWQPSGTPSPFVAGGRHLDQLIAWEVRLACKTLLLHVWEYSDTVHVPRTAWTSSNPRLSSYTPHPMIGYSRRMWGTLDLLTSWADAGPPEDIPKSWQHTPGACWCALSVALPEKTRCACWCACTRPRVSQNALDHSAPKDGIPMFQTQPLAHHRTH